MLMLFGTSCIPTMATPAHTRRRTASKFEQMTSFHYSPFSLLGSLKATARDGRVTQRCGSGTNVNRAVNTGKPLCKVTQQSAERERGETLQTDERGRLWMKKKEEKKAQHPRMPILQFTSRENAREKSRWIAPSAGVEGALERGGGGGQQKSRLTLSERAFYLLSDHRASLLYSFKSLSSPPGCCFHCITLLSVTKSGAHLCSTRLDLQECSGCLKHDKHDKHSRHWVCQGKKKQMFMLPFFFFNQSIIISGKNNDGTSSCILTSKRHYI